MMKEDLRMEEWFDGKLIRIDYLEFDHIFVVSDVHNDYINLTKAVKKLQMDKEHNLLIIAGDLIDRGYQPHPEELLDYVFDGVEKGNIIYLKGNHESMLCEHIRSEYHPSVEPEFREQYHYNTLQILEQRGYTDEMIRELGEKLEKLPLMVEIETGDTLYRIGHAELPDKELTLKHIVEKDVVWGDYFWQAYYSRFFKNKDGKKLILITGHLPTAKLREEFERIYNDRRDYQIWFSDEKNGLLVQKIDIDCGNGYREFIPSVHLGVLKLGTMETFYF